MMSPADLPTALLLTGPRGIDLLAQAQALTIHSDTIVTIRDHTKPQSTKSGIYVDDIRDLQLTARTSRATQRKVVVIYDAALMTTEAQNAALKLLEEPPAGLHIILATHTPDQLLTTVRSRCQYRTVASSTLQSVLPVAKKARIEFMARGVEEERVRLSEDETYFEYKVAVFEQAKRYVSASRYDRLVIARQVGENREKALELLDASLLITHQLMKRQFTPQLQQRAKSLLATEDAVKRNGNIRLQLLANVLQ